jgi:phosphopantothenoylcysteine synthetase/decarboxylase
LFIPTDRVIFLTRKGKVLKQKPKKKRPIRVVLTAGPTRAYLDSVRYLSNYSTGELGFCLSQALTKKGIELFAVVGPTQQPFSKLAFKKLVEVETADEMADATLKLCRAYKPDYAIFAAAVLDFKPQKVLSGKVSSQNKKWKIELVPTPKIIDRVGQSYPQIKRIGFKLEWERKTRKELLEFAHDLLARKKHHAVCVNFLPQIKKGSHPLWIVTKKGQVQKLRTKAEIANALAELVTQPEAENV